MSGYEFIMLEERQIKVAFCDDDEDLLFMYLEVSKKINVKAYVYPNVRDLLRQLDEVQPDVIVSDIDMPDIDGFGLLSGLLDLDIQLPFIFLTGHPSNENIRKSYARGAFDFLQKPVNIRELDLAIKKAMTFHTPVKATSVMLAELLKKYAQ
ncbi:MAG: hypothetical protein BroJett040_24090 [Oligoflexia bacterium]|nr:MAG: hypothetical protein BroJett040_24090 [Oligoflexia bacterium]